MQEDSLGREPAKSIYLIADRVSEGDFQNGQQKDPVGASVVAG